MKEAMLYLDRLNIVEYPDGHGETMQLAMKDAKKAVRPFVRLRWSENNGRSHWRVIEAHYMAKI